MSQRNHYTIYSFKCQDHLLLASRLFCQPRNDGILPLLEVQLKLQNWNDDTIKCHEP